jgi:ABC-type transport system involved in multi-copper enzyme maturation permease subunit
MTPSVVLRLIVKDWYLHRATLAAIAALGGLSIGALYLRHGLTSLLAMFAALFATIFLGILLPQQTVINERQRQNLAFVMSLPVSPMQYTTAKVLANLVGFLALWLPIAGGCIATVFAAGYGGVIPLMLVAALAPFVTFALFLAVGIVSESAALATATMAACNVSYSFVWLFIARLPGFWDDLRSPVAIWSRPMLSIAAVESAAIVLAIGLTFYFQAKKTDFV